MPNVMAALPNIGGTLCSTPDGDFLRPAFPAIRVQHVSNLHPKFALEATPCGSMVDIQSATAEIRRGKKEEQQS